MAYNLFLRMYTEQDTFDRLRRIPFEDMRQLVIRFNLSNGPGQEPPPRSDLYRLMEANGWTLADYHETKDRAGPRKKL